MWRPTYAKWASAEPWPWTVIKPAVSADSSHICSFRCWCAWEKRMYTLTVCFAGYRPIIGAEACLHLTLAQLELMRVSQLGSADVAYSLLLPCPSLGYVHWHPRGPWGVSTHLWTGLQITRLVLLQQGEDWHTDGIIQLLIPHTQGTLPCYLRCMWSSCAITVNS